MKRHFGLLIVIVLLSLLLIPPLAAQEAGPAHVGLRPDAPTYGVSGPYWVGIRDKAITFDYPDGTQRESRVTVWYPALNPEQTLEGYTYPAERRITEAGGPLFFPRTGHALLDAPPNTEDAPYPLIIYSHGGWGYRWYNPEYCEHLTSYGFVVIATDHEDAPPAGFMPPHAEISRQWDITALIDYATQLPSSDNTFAGIVDVERVGVTGYSAGGFTAMLAGGAQRSSQTRSAWCATEETRSSWVGPLLCTDEDARDQIWAELLELETPPTDLWPPIGDLRVDAIVSLDGGAFDFGADGLNALRVPALLFFARGAPTAMPYPLETIYENLSGTQRAVAVFENADHALFMHACREGMMMAETIGVCAEPVWDKQRAYDLIHHLATALFLSVLYGNADATAALAPDAVSFPGVTYEATGF